MLFRCIITWQLMLYFHTVHYQYFRECYMKFRYKNGGRWIGIGGMRTTHCFWIENFWYDVYSVFRSLGFVYMRIKSQNILLDMLMSAFWHLCYYYGLNKTHFWILAGIIVISWVYSVLISWVASWVEVKTLFYVLYTILCCVKMFRCVPWL